jgi:hypothetical protein
MLPTHYHVILPPTVAKWEGDSISTVPDGMFGGMEIRSATMVDSKIEVEVDFYVVPMPKDANTKNSEGLRPQDLFCSRDGGYFDTASFFKEPISVCYPSLLDFFAL